jgi:homocysteine S-methyltransferase
MIANPFERFLDHVGVVVLDGGLATELERRGANLNDPLWSARLLLENPELIRQVHLDYFRAGADVATSASYQATFPGLERYGLDRKQAASVLRLSVRLAREARDIFWTEPGRHADRLMPLVAASVGCYGAFLHDGSEYRGDYGLSCRQLMDFHRARLEILAESGADLIAFETIPCMAEAEALVRLLEDFPNTQAWLSFSCRDGGHICHGEFLAEGATLANSAEQIVAFGLNCTPPKYVVALLDSVAGQTYKPVLVYPNRGETWDAARRSWQAGPDMPADWGLAARQWYDHGARLIGGCCRTTPEDIRCARAAVVKPSSCY